jgi:TolB-like protein/DNA-binding SARP family transcriptional activator
MHARTQLRKALHGLRTTIGVDAFLTRGDEEIRLDTKMVWCDAVAFRRHCDAREWTEALALYRGDLLEGLFPGGVGEAFETWLAEQRAGLRALAARAAWESSAAADVAGRRDEAIALARRAAELNLDDEEGIRRLIAALDRYGDRAGALRMFADWQSRLKKEFDAEPAPETRKLARRVQAPRKGESIETSPSLIPLASPPVAEGEIGPVAHSNSDVRQSRKFSYRIVLIAAIAVFAFASILIAARLSNSDSAKSGTVAVLPLRGLGDSTATLAGEAIAEELTTNLTQLQGVDVRSSARSKAALDSAGNIKEIGHRLTVAHIVDGSVQRDAGKLRVNIRLVRVSDASTRWARSFDLDATDLLSSQAQIATAVVDALGPLLTRPKAN